MRAGEEGSKGSGACQPKNHLQLPQATHSAVASQDCCYLGSDYKGSFADAAHIVVSVVVRERLDDARWCLISNNVIPACLRRQYWAEVVSEIVKMKTESKRCCTLNSLVQQVVATVLWSRRIRCRTPHVM